MRIASERATGLPDYAVHRVGAIKRRLVAEGHDVIDLSVGDADLAPPAVAVEALAAAAREPRMSRYGFQAGLLAFREAAARYMERRFGVRVDPVKEIVPLLGSKDGLAHLPFAVLDPGDGCVIPEPGYPPYVGGALLAGADPVICPLRPERNFLVELDDIPADRLSRVRLVFLNYPNNPTAAIAPRDYLERTVAICRQRGIVLAYDNPYCEITFDGYRAPSIFEIDGAREVAIEFHSLSKSFGMTGWRIGWAVARPELISAFVTVKQFIDTGPFLGIQQAAAVTLDASDTIVPQVRELFRVRRDAGVAALRAAGFDVESPKATMYLWVPLPPDVPSAPFAERLLEEEYVGVLAGSSFGAGGEGFFRIALTVDGPRLAEAVTRIARVSSGVQGSV
jgi:LL-diaminopimelate aminotransferase